MAHRNGRRLLVHPDHESYLRGFADAMRQARAEIGVASYETMTELKRLQIEVADLRRMHAEATAAMRQMQSVALARMQARAENRERTLVEAWAAERDPATPLN
jgi:ABC-type siderophore export system fused ATPase/permease subunit